MGRYRLVDVKEIELGIGFFVKSEKEAEFALELYNKDISKR